jgi:hypothetical protein
MSKNKPKKTLEENGIDIRQSPFDVEDCPDEVRDLFQLLHDVKRLRLKTFARTIRNHRSNSSQGPRIQAAFTYDKWLYDRAAELAARCSNPDLDDKSEAEWIKLLQPAVLFRFDRDGEDRAEFHHWYG